MSLNVAFHARFSVRAHRARINLPTWPVQPQSKLETLPAYQASCRREQVLQRRAQQHSPSAPTLRVCDSVCQQVDDRRAEELASSLITPVSGWAPRGPQTPRARSTHSLCTVESRNGKVRLHAEAGGAGCMRTEPQVGWGAATASRCGGLNLYHMAPTPPLCAPARACRASATPGEARAAPSWCGRGGPGRPSTPTF